MTTQVDEVMRGVLTQNHNRLSPAVDVVAKAHMLLPDGLMLASWTLLPGKVDGQVAKTDDVTAIGWVVELSRLPGWRLEQSGPKASRFLNSQYFTVAAITQMDGVELKIWAHVEADAGQVAA